MAQKNAPGTFEDKAEIEPGCGKTEVSPLAREGKHARARVCVAFSLFTPWQDGFTSVPDLGN